MARNQKVVAVLTTVTGAAQARKLARAIVAARLAACVQTFPIHSTYWWQGKIESATERLAVAKTDEKLAPRLMRFIRKHHPYQLPEIVVVPLAGGLKEYLAWIRQETCGGTRRSRCRR